jgi:hypothetical protein
MNYLLDKELINNWQPLPTTVPSLPIPPEGYDRWHYVGLGWDTEGPIGRPWASCFSHDRHWEIIWNGDDNWPTGGDELHYIVAVRDNEARRSLIRLYDVARKLAHTLSPIDQEVWNALDDAEDVLCNEMWELKDKR